METQATPRPWHIAQLKHDQELGDIAYIYGPAPKSMPSPQVCTSIATGRDRAGAEANAALIVAAVNQHDALVETLEEVADTAGLAPAATLYAARKRLAYIVALARAVLDAAK